MLGTAENAEKQVSSMPAKPVVPAMFDIVSSSRVCLNDGSMFESSILLILPANSFARNASSVNCGRARFLSGEDILTGDCRRNFEGGRLTSSMKGELGGPEGLVGGRFSSNRLGLLTVEGDARDRNLLGDAFWFIRDGDNGESGSAMVLLRKSTL